MNSLANLGLNCRRTPTLISSLWWQMFGHIIFTTFDCTITNTMVVWRVHIITLIEAQVFTFPIIDCLFLDSLKVWNYSTTNFITMQGVKVCSHQNESKIKDSILVKHVILSWGNLWFFYFFLYFSKVTMMGWMKKFYNKKNICM